MTLRGYHDIPQDEWPSREDALRIVEALRLSEAGTVRELETLSGVGNINRVAHHSYLVYGFPELESGAFARALNDVFMSRDYGSPKVSRKVAHKALPSQPKGDPETAHVADAYGFTPRA